MIKDIIVNLTVGDRPGPAGEYAISVAAAFEAHLSAIAFVYDPIIPVSGAGYIPADVIEMQERENTAASKAALDRFTAASTRAGITAEPLTLSASLAGVGEQFSHLARRFDLAIVGQAEPDRSAVEEVIAEATLFESGRPLIIVPYIQKDLLKLDRVMVCWDGSRAATRPLPTPCRYSRKPAKSKSSLSATNAASRMKSKAPIWRNTLRGTGSKLRSSARCLATSMSPT